MDTIIQLGFSYDEMIQFLEDTKNYSVKQEVQTIRIEDPTSNDEQFKNVIVHKIYKWGVDLLKPADDKDLHQWRQILIDTFTKEFKQKLLMS